MVCSFPWCWRTFLPSYPRVDSPSVTAQHMLSDAFDSASLPRHVPDSELACIGAVLSQGVYLGPSQSQLGSPAAWATALTAASGSLASGLTRSIRTSAAAGWEQPTGGGGGGRSHVSSSVAAVGRRLWDESSEPSHQGTLCNGMRQC